MATQAMVSAGSSADTFFERHAWKVLLAISSILAFFGLTDVFGGASNLQSGETALMHSLTNTSWNELQSADPGAAHLVEWLSRAGGLSLFTLGVLAGAICLFGLRRGERWAWWALWTLPIWMLLTIVTLRSAVEHRGYGTPVPVISSSFFFILSSLMLALSRRKYFRRRGLV